MSRLSLKEKKDKAIKTDYASMSTKYKSEYIFNQLSEKYFLAPDTLRNIVYSKGV